MLSKIREYINKNQLLSLKDHVLAGVSGGADSMCLLNILLALKEEYELAITVVHVNHMLRGLEADMEEQYVKDFCESKGINCICVRRDAGKIAKQQGISLEEAGRNLRYQIFDEECQRLKCHKIAIAHNQNDNAETVLFHLFRGSSVAGAAGITPMRGKIIRPLLPVTRSEIESWLNTEHISFCTDSSNLTLDYTRNKIRHEILAYASKEINTKAIEHVAEFAEQMQSVAAYLNRQAMKAYEQAACENEEQVILSVERLMDEDPVIVQAVVKKAIETVAKKSKDIESVHVLAACELLAKQVGKQIHLPDNIIVNRGYTTLTVSIFTNNSPSADIYESACIPGSNPIPSEGLIFSFQLIYECQLDSIPKNCYTKWFDYDKIKDTVVIRTRKQGDYLQIHRDGATKTLKSVLINEKVPKVKRDRMCLLAAGSHILWIPFVRTTEAFLVDDKTTTILSITLENANK